MARLVDLFPEHTIIDTRDMPRDEWLALRYDGLGGSDAGPILSASKYESPMTVWMDKTGVRRREDISGKAAVKWGVLLEEPIAQDFAATHGYEMWHPNAMFIHPARPWMICNPDRFFIDEHGEVCLLEVKTGGYFTQEDWADDQIPETYELQVWHYLAVLGLRKAAVVGLLGGQHTVVRWIVNPAPALLQNLVEIEQAFWEDHVVAGVAPPVDSSGATTEALNRLWAAAEGKKVELGREALDIIARYHAASVAIDAAEADKAEAGNELRMLLGDAEVGLYAGRPVVTWKEQTSVRAQSGPPKQHVKWLRDHGFVEAAEIVEANCLSASPSRVLRPKGKPKP